MARGDHGYLVIFQQVDLDAVAAAYDGYVEDLHRQLRHEVPG